MENKYYIVSVAFPRGNVETIVSEFDDEAEAFNYFKMLVSNNRRIVLFKGIMIKNSGMKLSTD